jgi:hypothetical protein
MHKYAPFQNLWLRFLLAAEHYPIGAPSEECLHPRGSSPIEVVVGIQSVTESWRNRNDSLMLVVGEGNENVHRTDSLILWVAELLKKTTRMSTATRA